MFIHMNESHMYVIEQNMPKTNNAILFQLETFLKTGKTKLLNLGMLV